MIKRSTSDTTHSRWVPVTA